MVPVTDVGRGAPGGERSSPPERRPVLSNRSVLAGFAGLLALMGCLTIDSARQTRDLSRTSAALRRHSRERDDLLDQLRTDIYRSATLARDYLLERDEALAADQKAELTMLRAAVQQTLDHYVERSPAREKTAIENLRQYTGSYWASLAPTLNWSRAMRRERGEQFLRNTVIPRRDELVQFVRQVTALNVRALDDEEGQIQLVQSRFQTRVNTISILALALGIVLAVFVVRHTRRLGAEAAARFDQVVAAREDLRRLSDRLVVVQEEERRKLSRELHDDLGQTMSAMLIELRNLESAAPGPETQREGMASVRRLAEENVAKVRNMALLLRPGMLDELGLVPALRWQARAVARRTGVKVKLMADELQDDLPDSSRTCIYRVVQEALNNCVKHARAKEVRVVIHRDADGLAVSVQDDGVGFDPERNKGLGLLGMMERVSAIGGRFHVESQPGRGTILSTWLPLDSGQCRPEGETVA